MTGRVLGAHSEILHDSTKPTKMTAEQENIFGKTVKNVIP